MSRDFRHDTEIEPNTRTSSPVSDLVEALMEWSKPDTGSHDAGVQLVCSEAATTLTTLSTKNAELEAEIARLRADRDDFKDEWQAELEKRKDVQARLRAALAYHPRDTSSIVSHETGK